jgi:hypothetical protein
MRLRRAREGYIISATRARALVKKSLGRGERKETDNVRVKINAFCSYFIYNNVIICALCCMGNAVRRQGNDALFLTDLAAHS